jgi:hypothetical protein
MYVIPDGSDITSPGLRVANINLTEYQESLFPKTKKFLRDPKVKYMTLREKVEFSDPSYEIRV